MNDSTTKRCTKCLQFYPPTIEFFYAEKNKSGLTARCRKCARLQATKWARNNPEKRHAIQNRYSRSAKGKRTKQAWHQSKPGYSRKQAAKYHAQHPDRIRAYRRKYNAAHPEVRREYFRRYRARKVKAGGTYTVQDIERLYALQKGRCWWCGDPLNNVYHVDHRIPLSKGGSNWLSNLVLACPHCNLSKSNKMPSDFNGRLL